MIMDYEKLHKDTITKLQEMVNSGKITAEIARGICADFVPESEDERIMKSLKILLQHFCNGYRVPGLDFPVSYKDMLAWLEKQGEQKTVDEIAKEVCKNKASAITFLKSAGIMNEKGELADEYKIEQDEQNSAWSEEDERMYKGLHNLIYSTPYCDSRKEFSDWFKSLKERVQPQPKQKWSEEDERNLDWLITVCERIHYKSDPQVSPESALMLREWLKSLRPQNRWKPSEEQMNNK